VGGVAARAHGAKREVNDIDLYVLDRDLARVQGLAGERLTQGPLQFVDEHWDLTFLELRCRGWQIEIAGADTAKVWNQTWEEWRPAGIDFSASVLRSFEGSTIPVMPLGQLADYKRGLGRAVDLQDLAELGLGESRD
jgi:hypothetical protein